MNDGTNLKKGIKNVSKIKRVKNILRIILVIIVLDLLFVTGIQIPFHKRTNMPRFSKVGAFIYRTKKSKFQILRHSNVQYSETLCTRSGQLR